MRGDIRAIIKQLESLGALGLAAAPDCAIAVKNLIDARIAAGIDIYGVPFIPKADGSQPLVHAAKAVTVTTQGKRIIIRVSGWEARHSYGGVRGGIARPIAPTKTSVKKRGVPPAIFEAIKAVLDAHESRLMRGAA